MGQCNWLAFGGFPGTHTVSTHFIHFQYMTGALLADALVLGPRMDGFPYILSPCRPFKWTLLSNRQFLLPPQTPLVFTVRSYEAFSSQHWNPGLCGLVWGWGRSLSRYCSWFFSTMHERGTTCSIAATSASLCHTMSSPPYLSISTRPTHLDKYGFFKSLVVGLPYSSIFWQFWVFLVSTLVAILLVVAQEGETCLSIPLSWPQVKC